MSTVTKAQLIAAMKDLDDDAPISIVVITEKQEGSYSGEQFDIERVIVSLNGSAGQIEVLDL